MCFFCKSDNLSDLCKGGGIMSTYEAITLMLTFGLLLINLIGYLDNHNKTRKKTTRK
jgi:hypothetical protein